jgi:hypothetical protein
MKTSRIVALLGACGTVLLASEVAVAQPVPATTHAKAGMVIKDAAGATVGTVLSIDGNMLVVKTDRHEVRLPSSSFTPHQGQLLFGMTRDQLNAHVDAELAKAAAQIAPGATVRGSAGAVVGTIEALDQDYITLKLTDGRKVRLPKTSVGPGPDGPVLGLTSAELDAAVKASGQ